MYKGIIPIAFPNQKKVANNVQVIAADVGGTKTNLALFEMKDNELILIYEAKYASQKYPSFGAIVKDFLNGKPSPEILSIGFAGPVSKNAAKATNLSWMIDTPHLSTELDIAQVLHSK